MIFPFCHELNGIVFDFFHFLADMMISYVFMDVDMHFGWLLINIVTTIHISRLFDGISCISMS